jgi:hypothetical protein
VTAAVSTKKDRKGREYRSLGPFMDRMQLNVYVTKAAKGQRREDDARVVLVGHVPELRVALDPWRAKALDRRAALMLLWDRLVELVDDRAAPSECCEAFKAALAQEGLQPPPGPLHQPGLPRVARLVLAYRQAHPAASQRMVAKAVGCDPARVCQVYRQYGDPASVGAERRAESALNIQREFSADSARGEAPETNASPEQSPENRITVPGPNSAPPPCTSSFLRKEDDGAPPPDAGVPRPAFEGPPRPVVAGNAVSNPHSTHRGNRLPEPLASIPDDCRWAVLAVMKLEVQKPGSAVRFLIAQNEPRGAKTDSALDHAVEMGYIEEAVGTGGRLRYWVPKAPELVRLVEQLRSRPRSVAS